MTVELLRDYPLEQATFRVVPYALNIEGIIMSRSSPVFSLELAFGYAKAQGMGLVDLDRAIIARDALDLNPLGNRQKSSLRDYSDAMQRTSTCATYGVTKKGQFWVAGWSLHELCGTDLGMHQKVITELIEDQENYARNGKTKPNHETISVTMLRLIQNKKRMVEIPSDSDKPGECITVPLETYGTHPLAMTFMPTCAKRNAEFLQRKGYKEANFFLWDGDLYKQLKGTANTATFFLTLGGDNGANQIDAMDQFRERAYGRGMAIS